jgi:hypothetical protein
LPEEKQVVIPQLIGGQYHCGVDLEWCLCCECQHCGYNDNGILRRDNSVSEL